MVSTLDYGINTKALIFLCVWGALTFVAHMNFIDELFDENAFYDSLTDPSPCTPESFKVDNSWSDDNLKTVVCETMDCDVQVGDFRTEVAVYSPCAGASIEVTLKNDHQKVTVYCVGCSLTRNGEDASDDVTKEQLSDSLHESIYSDKCDPECDTEPSQAQCANTKWMCDNGDCITWWRECDGGVDCMDGSDENSHCSASGAPAPTAAPTAFPTPDMTAMPTVESACIVHETRNFNGYTGYLMPNENGLANADESADFFCDLTLPGTSAVSYQLETMMVQPLECWGFVDESDAICSPCCVGDSGVGQWITSVTCCVDLVPAPAPAPAPGHDKKLLSLNDLSVLGPQQIPKKLLLKEESWPLLPPDQPVRDMSAAYSSEAYRSDGIIQVKQADVETQCEDGFLLCRSEGKCVTEEHECDAVLNCEDGSDEYFCPLQGLRKATDYAISGLTFFLLREVIGICLFVFAYCNGRPVWQQVVFVQTCWFSGVVLFITFTKHAIGELNRVRDEGKPRFWWLTFCALKIVTDDIMFLQAANRYGMSRTTASRSVMAFSIMMIFFMLVYWYMIFGNHFRAVPNDQNAVVMQGRGQQANVQARVPHVVGGQPLAVGPPPNYDEPPAYRG